MKKLLFLSLFGFISFAAPQFTPCELANQKIMNVMGDLKTKDQEFKAEYDKYLSDLAKFDESPLAKSYNTIRTIFPKLNTFHKLRDFSEGGNPIEGFVYLQSLAKDTKPNAQQFFNSTLESVEMSQNQFNELQNLTKGLELTDIIKKYQTEIAAFNQREANIKNALDQRIFQHPDYIAAVQESDRLCRR